MKGDNIEMQMDNISSLLDKPVISIIPESEDFRKAVNIKQPLVYAYPNSKPSQAFNHLASCLTGENYEGNILLEKEGGFLVFLLKKFGFLK